MNPVRWFFALLISFWLSGCEPAQSSRLLPYGQLRLGAILGDTDLTGYSRADQVIDFQFPRDHRTHDSFRSEWWYLVFMLSDSTGAEFGVQFTIFRQALLPRPVSTNPWQTNQAYLGHFAVTDVAASAHRAYERVARGHPQLAGTQPGGFVLTLDGWLLEAVAAEPALWHLRASAGEDMLDVQLSPEKPVVLQGEAGLSAKSAGNASYYYSIPRLKVSGLLLLQGEAHRVEGTAWFDREWSTSVLSDDQVGWDWFALQLEDGRDLMVFQLRNKRGGRDSYDHGIWVAADGRSRLLRAADFTLVPLAYWMDEDNARWPVQWQLRIGEELWRIQAAIADQRMATTLVYWEGLTDIFNAADERVGRGYMELTGYADEL